MKSNRTRLQPQVTFPPSFRRSFRGLHSVRLTEMPAPEALPEISPDQVVTDILICTLERVQRSSSPSVAAAAARYLESLR
jgi:hypothetical protein